MGVRCESSFSFFLAVGFCSSVLLGASFGVSFGEFNFACFVCVGSFCFRRVGLLAGGDVVALLVFAAIGRFSHGFPVFDLETLRTADPFVAGMFKHSPFSRKLRFSSAMFTLSNAPIFHVHGRRELGKIRSCVSMNLFLIRLGNLTLCLNVWKSWVAEE